MRFPVLYYLLFIAISKLQSIISNDNLLQCTKTDNLTNTSSEMIMKQCTMCVEEQHKLTIIMLYHNECDILYYQTKQWQEISPELSKYIRFLIVDDHSLIPACNCIKKSSTESVKIDIVRIDSDRIWNIGGARNLGAYVSCTDFIFICDIDALVTEVILTNILPLIIKHTSAYDKVIQLNRKTRKERYGNTHTVHPGVMMLSRDLYWKLNGCDEDFVGHYGFTDKHFMYRLSMKGYNVIIQENLHIHLITSTSKRKIESMIPSNSRNFWNNFRLFNKKMNGSLAWSQKFLRFNWHEGCSISSQDTILQNKYLELLQYANHSISSESVAKNVKVLYEWI